MNIVCDEFDSTKYCLGGICKRGHKWGDTGKSLRYKISNACLKCLGIKPSRTTEQRFWEKVDKSQECWKWIATKQSNDYGSFHFKGKIRQASRVAWELTYGAIPDNLHCLHRCDNPGCVRPEHLFLGTHLDNMTDMYSKGRRQAAKGVKNGNSKLSEEQVRQIREMYVPYKMSQPAIAKLFGISLSQVNQIIYGRDWKHI